VGRPVLTLIAPERTEHELQIACTTMLHRILRPDVAWTAVDLAHSLDWRVGRNGKPIGLIEVQKRKARGCRAGVPDYLFWHSGSSFAIELKRNADETLSDDQRDFCSGLLRAHVQLKICWDERQVYDAVSSWGLSRGARQ
jgi:hypothetical protein